MVKKKAMKNPVPSKTIFVDSEVPRAKPDYAGLRYGMAKVRKKSTLENVVEGVGKAIGVKPEKPRLPAVPSSSVQVPPPSMSRGKEIFGRVVRKKKVRDQ